MASASAVVERLSWARAQCQAACDLLLSPTVDAMDRCAALLEAAGTGMASLRQDLSDVRGDAEVLEEAWQVRRTFQRAAKLFDNAARFHQNWTSLRGSMTGGYTSTGEAAPIRAHARIFLEA